jgi:hypothetical protein
VAAAAAAAGLTPGQVGGCTRRIQSTHSARNRLVSTLGAYEVKNWFQSLLSKFNLYRYRRVLLRWNVDRGVAVLPKSSNPARQADNLAAAAADAAQLPSEHAAAVGAFSEQYRLQHGAFHTGPGKPYATLGDLWDEDCSYMKGRDFEQPAGFALK